MRKLNRTEIENILLGCTILGTGGGGPLENGMALIDEALAAGKEFVLASFDEVSPDTYIGTPYGCGAISPLTEEDIKKYERLPLPEKSPYLIAMENVERVIGRPLDAVISTELGGENTACAFYTAAMTGRIIMDGDPAGRSVPCLQHSTYYLDGIPMCPMAVTNDFGESAVFTHVADDTRGEDLVRALAAVSRNEIMVVDHVNTAAVLEKSVILGAISDAEKLGVAYREALAKGEDCVEAILRTRKGRRVFDGSVVAAEYETVDGYTYGPMQVKAAETIGSVMGKELGATLLFLCIFRSVWYTAAKKIHREGSAMRAEERRQAILNTLNSAGHPVSASALARQFSVSRQIVVGDVALLRAAGANISATPRGYVVLRESGGLIRQVACQHDAAGMEAELNAMVDHGCTVLDVIVDHPIYGQLTGPLQLASRYDVSQFIARCARAEARPLSDLTGGIHLHTLSCPDEATFQRVEDALRDMSVLLE